MIKKIGLGLLLIVLIACGFQVGREVTTLGKATVCDYKVVFITTAQYRTIEEFWIGVGDTVTYLNGNGYRVLDLIPKYGMDMTQKEVLKFVYIKYIKEVKNE